MRVITLINAKAGSVDGEAPSEEAQRLREGFEAAGVEAEVRAVPGRVLAEAARQAAGAGVDAVVAGGGDGTISAVAGALAGSGMPMGVLPLGTLNHFAKDVGIPGDLEQAMRVIAAGAARPVDVGEVNGRVFINNSSIGLYPQLVHEREEQRRRLGRGKWAALAVAILGAMRRFPMLQVRLSANGKSAARLTPFVFIGNNAYEIAPPAIGARARLDAGQLYLFLANRTGRLGLVRLLLRAMVGRLDQAADFESASLAEVWIESRRHRLLVALDGEVTHMAPPLHYRIRPGALRVLAPMHYTQP